MDDFFSVFDRKNQDSGSRRMVHPVSSRRKEQQRARRTPTCLDLFCGAGGLSEGFRQAGFHTVAANDSDPWAGATFKLNHDRHGTEFVLGDIGSPEVQEQLLDYVRGQEIDVVIGGPPCQAFSQVRNHHRVINDPRNSLYRQYVAMIRKVTPRVFVMENVPGLENLAGGAVRNQILEDLALDGEYLVDLRVVDAAYFGVPQNRLRVIFVGVRGDLRTEPRFPSGSDIGKLPTLVRLPRENNLGSRRYRHAKSPETERPLGKLLDPECTDLVTVSQAIGDLCGLRPNPKLVRRPSDKAQPYETDASSAYQRARRSGSPELFNVDVPSIREDTVARLNTIPAGGNFRDLPEELTLRYLNGKKWGPNLGRKNLSRKYFFAYRKLHPDHFSWTLNTKSDCVYHYSTPRALTVREFARLHSFDDSYHFLAGDRHSRYSQVGNAVPPLFAKEIGRTVKVILDKRESSEAKLNGPSQIVLKA